MSDDYRELLIGCGAKRGKNVHIPGREAWSNLVTLDLNTDHHPDIVCDLRKPPYPLPDDFCNEIHAYEVLEHIGQQGDFELFFAQFSEFWRILRPGGILAGTSPAAGTPWVWGDPGHTRAIQPETFAFLAQPSYTKQVGVTSMTDYRFLYRADFNLVHAETKGTAFVYVLQAVKPSRITGPHTGHA